MAADLGGDVVGGQPRLAYHRASNGFGRRGTPAASRIAVIEILNAATTAIRTGFAVHDLAGA